jgi:cation diffusion facilitator family transporter
MIFATGTEILREAYLRLSLPHDIKVSVMSFIVMAVTLAVNIGVMIYETRKGLELKSDFLTADAMHTQSDIYISLSVIISLIAAKAGYPVVDIIAAFVITLFIAKMGFSILKSAANVLADTACINPDDIRKVVMNIQGVRDCHGIRTRGNRDFINLDLHLLVDPEEKIQDAHTIAHNVEDAVKKGFRSIVDVVIHVEPYKKQSD